MKKFPPAKITAIVTTVVLICILIQIPGALASNPVADPNGPYFMDEGTTKDLDGTGSVDAENYNWIITTDPTDEAYLKKADTDEPTFHAPEEVTGGDKTVDVKLIVTDNDGDTDSETTSVTIRDLLRARPGESYQVVENDTVTLDGSNSSGEPDNYSWVIVNDPTNEAYLTNAGGVEAELHAPLVDRNETVDVRLTVYKNNNSHSKETEVEIKDPVIADLNGPYSLFERENTLLYGDGSTGSNGSEIKSWKWAIIDDPTENCYLKNADKENARLFAPQEIDNNKIIKVRLRVKDQNDKSDSENIKIKLKDELLARPNGPYEVIEGENVVLDGTKSSGYIEEYSWIISEDPTGGAKLNKADNETPIFIADGNVETAQWVKVELTVSDENNNTHSENTKVKVEDRLTSKPGGPYHVVENQSIELDGKGSEGDNISFNWEITDDPTGQAYITEKNTSTPTFHALDGLENEKTVKIRLTVTDGENDNDSATTEVMIKDALIARPNGPYEVTENHTLELDGAKSSGDIKNFNWIIKDDPTGEVRITENDTSTPVFHAPETVGNPETVKVKLLISNDLDSDFKTTEVKVKPSIMPPASPQNLKVEGSTNPTNIKTPKPTFSSKYVVANNAPASKVQIQMGTTENGHNVWDYTKENITVSPDNRYEISYNGSTLEAGRTYYWRMRYYANGIWGDWSDGTAQLDMASLKTIINNVTDGQERDIVYILFKASTKSAASSLEDADTNSAAKVIEEAVTVRKSDTGNILETMNLQARVEILLEVFNLEHTPAKAADLLESMNTEEAAKTVRTLLKQEEFEELNKIFEELSGTVKDEIFESDILDKEEKNKLLSKLSEKAKEDMTYKTGGGGLNWLLIGGIVAGAVAAVIVLLIFTGEIELESGKKEEKKTEKGKKTPKKEKWADIIKKFLKSGRKQAGIKTEMPVRQAVKSVRSTIKELGGENIVGAEQREGKLYLVRKS